MSSSVYPSIRISGLADRMIEREMTQPDWRGMGWIYIIECIVPARARAVGPQGITLPSIHLYKPIYVWMGRSHNWVMGVKTRTEFGSIPQRKRNMSFVSPDQWSR